MKFIATDERLELPPLRPVRSRTLPACADQIPGIQGIRSETGFPADPPRVQEASIALLYELIGVPHAGFDADDIRLAASQNSASTRTPK